VVQYCQLVPCGSKIDKADWIADESSKLKEEQTEQSAGKMEMLANVEVQIVSVQ